MAAEYSVLFVCMGNICRSPTAEGVLRHLVHEAGLQHAVRIDSAGTLDYHAGSPPDPRSQRHAGNRGYDLAALRARQVEAGDFERFDLILAMDWQNLHELKELCPAAYQYKLRRLMEFAPPGISDAEWIVMEALWERPAQTASELTASGRFAFAGAFLQEPLSYDVDLGQTSSFGCCHGSFPGAHGV